MVTLLLDSSYQIGQSTSGFNVEDMTVYRHWHRESEAYAGGDSLATALFLGWTIREIVWLKEYSYRGSRQAVVYYFQLKRDKDYMSMPVISNPYVEKIIATSGLQIILPAITLGLKNISMQNQI
jgi:hypothetical protein